MQILYHTFPGFFPDPPPFRGEKFYLGQKSNWDHFKVNLDSDFTMKEPYGKGGYRGSQNRKPNLKLAKNRIPHLKWAKNRKPHPETANCISKSPSPWVVKPCCYEYDMCTSLVTIDTFSIDFTCIEALSFWSDIHWTNISMDTTRGMRFLNLSNAWKAEEVPIIIDHTPLTCYTPFLFF